VTRVIVALSRPLVRRALLIALAAAAAAVIVLYVMIRRVDGLQPTGPADCIIVLGAGVRDGGPGRCYRPRLDYALTLHRQGFAEHIIVTELSPAAEVARDYLLDRGVPPKVIALESRSRDTVQNLAYSREIMAERGWRTAIVVTCPFHVFRSRRIARDLGMDAQMAAAPNSPTELTLWRHVKYTLRECVAWPRHRLLGS